MTISTAELAGEWEVEILPLGQRITLRAGPGPLQPQCNSWCGASVAARLAPTEYGLANVSVEIVHLAAENDLGVFTISMLDDSLFGSLRVNEAGQPLLTADDSPNFWLEGLMTIKFRLHGSEEIVSLASRQPVLQVGRATSWPPYNTTMHDVSGPNEYYRRDNQAGDPLLLLWSGSITILDHESPFLATDIIIHSFDYLYSGSEIEGVRLNWTDKRAEVELIDHYHVLRRAHDVHGTGSWEQVGGCISGDTFVDRNFNGTQPITYKVRQVFIDPLGDEVHGCGMETDFTVPALPASPHQLRASGFWGS
jgi:hypothetical protein